MEKKEYLPPEITVLEFNVERGYAISVLQTALTWEVWIQMSNENEYEHYGANSWEKSDGTDEGWY